MKDKIVDIFTNPFALLFISGASLNISFLIHNSYAQMLSLVSIAPAFYAITKLDGKKKLFGGMIFSVPWLLIFTPGFFHTLEQFGLPIWAIVFAFPLGLLGIVLFYSLPFYIPVFLRKKNIIIEFFVIIIFWIILLAVRIYPPEIGEIPLPSIVYTQWVNPSILQVASFASIPGIVLIILLLNAALAFLLIKKKHILLMIFIAILLSSNIAGNYILQQTKSSGEIDITLVTIQAYPSLGENDWYAEVEDIELLMSMTEEALAQTSGFVIVAWPENGITEEDEYLVRNFTIENNIFLIYNIQLQNGDELPFNAGRLMDQNGEILLTNYKEHGAPGEEITESSDFSIVNINGIDTATAVCYDLFNPSIGNKIRGTELLVGVINPEGFGEFYQYIFAANVVFRAVENRVNILACTTLGPSFYVNKYGVIEEEPVPLGVEDYLIITTKI